MHLHVSLTYLNTALHHVFSVKFLLKYTLIPSEDQGFKLRSRLWSCCVYRCCGQLRKNTADAATIVVVMGFGRLQKSQCCDFNCGSGPHFKTLRKILIISWNHIESWVVMGLCAQLLRTDWMHDCGSIYMVDDKNFSYNLQLDHVLWFWLWWCYPQRGLLIISFLVIASFQQNSLSNLYLFFSIFSQICTLVY